MTPRRTTRTGGRDAQRRASTTSKSRSKLARTASNARALVPPAAVLVDAPDLVRSPPIARVEPVDGGTDASTLVRALDSLPIWAGALLALCPRRVDRRPESGPRATPYH